MTGPDPASRIFLSPFRVRSYELDSLGHVNHAVYLNYLEQARFDALDLGGFPLPELVRRRWAVHVVRIEVDYRRECRLGDPLVVRTAVDRLRNSSMILAQELFRLRPGTDHSETSHPAATLQAPAEAGPEQLAGLEALEPAVSARVVGVWIGPDGRPMRIPDEVREALVPG